MMELTGFHRPVAFHFGWALAATVFGTVGTLPFFICYRAATGKWFTEYFWLLWTVWMIFIFFGLPGTYVGQKMLEVQDHPVLQEMQRRAEEAQEKDHPESEPFEPAEPVVLENDGWRV